MPHQPARDFDARRASYATNRTYGNDPYGPGAVTEYRRSNNDLDAYDRRSRSRGRRYSDRERDRSYSGSRSRSRTRSRSAHNGIRGKIDETFDPSMKGLGIGLAGRPILEVLRRSRAWL